MYTIRREITRRLFCFTSVWRKKKKKSTKFSVTGTRLRCPSPGFSLDSGHRITSSLDVTVVAGAPRANHSGAVVLLEKESDASSKLLVEHTFRGPGLASSFGYDVAVADLDGDGWETRSRSDSETSREKKETTHGRITCA